MAVGETPGQGCWNTPRIVEYFVTWHMMKRLFRRLVLASGGPICFFCNLKPLFKRNEDISKCLRDKILTNFWSHFGSLGQEFLRPTFWTRRRPWGRGCTKGYRKQGLEEYSRDPEFDQNTVRDSGKRKRSWRDSGFDCHPGSEIRKNLRTGYGNFCPSVGNSGNRHDPNKRSRGKSESTRRVQNYQSKENLHLTFMSVCRN